MQLFKNQTTMYTFVLEIRKISVLCLVVLFSTLGFASTSYTTFTNSSKDSIYYIADKMPVFPGGENQIFKFIYKNLNYPKKALADKTEGKVVVEFVVNKKGKVEQVEVVKSVSEELDKEAIKIIKKMPKWTPAMQDSQLVAVRQTLPIKFQISNLTPEEAWEPDENTLVVIDSIQMPEGFNVKILNPSKLTSYTEIKPFPKEVKKKIVKKFGSRATNGVVIVNTNKDDMYYTLADTTINKDSLGCSEPTTIPQFVGGKKALFRYITDSIHYPFVAKKSKTEGKVTVRFVVEKSGKISDVGIARSADYFLDREALRLINSMPNWIPGSKCGQKLAISVTMPIEFKLDIPLAERKWERNEKTIVLLDGKRMPASFDLKWINYGNLSLYKVLQPSSPEVTKKLVSDYGKDAVNGVVLIESVR